MDDAAKDDTDEAVIAKKAELERLGYRTEHLSSSEIDELMKRLDQERPSADWRSKL